MRNTPMAVKELTDLTLTDLFKGYKRMWNYWQDHVKDKYKPPFRKIDINKSHDILLTSET
jgi:hypothetical protein